MWFINCMFEGSQWLEKGKINALIPHPTRISVAGAGPGQRGGQRWPCVRPAPRPHVDGASGSKHKAQKWDPRAMRGGGRQSAGFYAMVPGKILSIFCFESKIPQLEMKQEKETKL